MAEGRIRLIGEKHCGKTGLAMAKKLTIFLDIDGVLTPIPKDGKPREWLAKLEFFEASIRPFLERIEIVISSSWRHVIDLHDFRSGLSDDIAAVVIGQTGVNRNCKLDEIDAWLAKHGSRTWVAIDDDESEFAFDWQLIKTDPSMGFNLESARRLRERIFDVSRSRDDWMAAEAIGAAAFAAAQTLKRNKESLKNDETLRRYLDVLRGETHENGILRSKVFTRIKESAPELSDLAISAFENRRGAAAWFCGPISATNPRTPLEYLISGDYELVEALILGIRQDRFS